MKKIIFILSFFLCAFTLSAQKDFLYKVFTVDTLTDAETINFVFPYTLDGVYEYEWQILTDSLSGDTGGTAYLQGANDRKGTNYTSISTKTHTIKGAATRTGAFITGTAYNTNQRLSVVGTGTQSTKLTILACYKKIGKGEMAKDVVYKAFSSDSTDAAESIYYTVTTPLQDRYYYSWQIIFDEVSGSATSTAQVQEAVDNKGSVYFDVLTKSSAQSADAAAFIEGTCFGTQQRLKVTQSTTGKWRYTVYFTAKKIR
jgi:hypothetical protein